ncbi:MAG: GNAT family N-acetyltransferase [Bacteroidota bacterium]
MTTASATKLEHLELPNQEGWCLHLYQSREEIQTVVPQSWSASKWIQREWLAYLAAGRPSTPTFWAELQHISGHRLGFTVQIMSFQAGRQIRQEDPAGFSWRRWLVRPLRFRVLTLGQLLTSGPYGWTGPHHQQVEEWQELVLEAGELLTKYYGCSGTLLKDLVTADHPAAHYWADQGYYALPVDPVMVLPLRTAWSSLEDYLLDLNSKYRVRYRRARKQLGAISKRRMKPAEVQKRSQELYQLFEAVRSGAAFDPVDPAADYFVALQRQWGTACEIIGYFDGDRLLGFTTALQDGEVQHAHYLGFEPTVNEAHHLYHNMLFDLIEGAIRRRASELNFARTALEIKSSVGAEARQYAVLLKGRSRFSNWLVRRFTPRLFKASKWLARHPFRHTEAAQLT